GVHGVGPGAPGHREDLVDLQVGRCARLTVERVGLVREPGVECITILVGVDGDRGYPGIASGADDAYGDLTAVGDEHLVDWHDCQPIEVTPDPFEHSPQERRENVAGYLRPQVGPGHAELAGQATDGRQRHADHGRRVAVDSRDERAAEAVHGECTGDVQRLAGGDVC